MVELVRGLDPERVARNLAAVREELAGAGVDPGRVEVLAAVKYVAVEDLGALAEGGVTVLGENRAQELAVKQEAWPAFTWDFIGHLQSRKVKDVLPRVRRIHSVGSDSVLDQLERRAAEHPAVEVLLEVNVAREEGKSGFAPEAVDEALARCALPVVGLMTMPPLARAPEDSRRWFAGLAELAAHHGLRELSMGTTQDFAVAAQEGATVVRIGSRLFA
ncbi:YggS family pyridoxal phosphate enzyme [Conexibacter sp. SYSU D00693]|uniref:YggS family pyridoxal phosphate enzyme n=1 Tax=Conexibacter sp. SYSU D00693 TaxID=2812560 RepID=UPI00196AA24F|nr:YggS family pyridoxal phosphate enzyme [Conexibacter sp. SYSU D00693]